MKLKVFLFYSMTVISCNEKHPNKPPTISDQISKDKKTTTSLSPQFLVREKKFFDSILNTSQWVADRLRYHIGDYNGNKKLLIYLVTFSGRSGAFVNDDSLTLKSKITAQKILSDVMKEESSSFSQLRVMYRTAEPYNEGFYDTLFIKSK